MQKWTVYKHAYNTDSTYTYYTDLYEALYFPNNKHGNFYQDTLNYIMEFREDHV